VESRGLGPLRRRDERLRDQQVRQVRERAPLGLGKSNPARLSNGSPEPARKREFHISVGENAALSTMGLRRWLRGPRRPGPTIPLLSMPIAIGWVSPKPCVGEWQPAHALSPLSAVTGSNQSRRPSSASCGSSRRPRRVSSVEARRPV
jgi:hypothetical protein